MEFAGQTLEWRYNVGGIFGLGGSSSKTDRSHELESWGNLKNIMYQTHKAGQDQTAEGTKGLSSAADYFKALMSGDSAKMSQVLAPQISIIKGQNQQRLNTTAQFGNRSGGTNASMQQGTEAAHKSIQELFDMLGPEAAKEFAGISGIQEQLGQGSTSESIAASSALGNQTGEQRQQDIQNEAMTAQAAGKSIAALMGIL